MAHQPYAVVCEFLRRVTNQNMFVMKRIDSFDAGACCHNGTQVAECLEYLDARAATRANRHNHDPGVPIPGFEIGNAASQGYDALNPVRTRCLHQLTACTRAYNVHAKSRG